MNSNQNIQSQILTPNLGIVLDGFNKTDIESEKGFQLVKDAFHKHYVVIIRNISLSASELKHFTHRFGNLFIHHADEGVLFADDTPEVLHMLKEPKGERLFGGSDWHADVTFRNPAGYVSILNSKIIPETGGDTLFASTIAAFSALSPGFQNTLRSLSAVHSYDGPNKPDHPTETATHPVVRKHPITGKEGIYINRMFVNRFSNMTYAESQPLIDFLDKHMTQPEFSFRHRWHQDDLILWDNRFTLHYPINDFEGQKRLLWRCTAMEHD